MLTIHRGAGRVSRRGFLRAGSLGLGGLALPGLLQARAGTASAGSLTTGKSVIFVFLHGGPSQIETFDPKMGAPAEFRSATGEIATALSGVTFGSSFPKLAALADRLAIVRSYTTGDGNHDIKPVVGRHTSGANLGSLYSRVAGTNNARNGMPTNVAVFPRSVDDTTQAATEAFGKWEATGPLGAAYAPFVPGSGGSLQQDMQLSIARQRLDDRRQLLKSLDNVKRTLEESRRDGLDRIADQAFEIVVNGVADAFDLSKESPETIARYDTAPLVRPDQIDRKWNNYNNYVDNAKTLGKLLLLARRMCERGCGFVTVTTNFVWDMHSDVNNAPVGEGMRYMGPPLDHAISAFLEDVSARGLSDDILLVVSGEMGRTPRINGGGGRDHWGGSAPLLLAGGGLKMGQVIGQTTRDGGAPQSEPQGISNLLATIGHTLFDVGALRIARGMPSEVIKAVGSADPIPGSM